jgi:hypothetical protein
VIRHDSLRVGPYQTLQHSDAGIATSLHLLSLNLVACTDVAPVYALVEAPDATSKQGEPGTSKGPHCAIFYSELLSDLETMLQSSPKRPVVWNA